MKQKFVALLLLTFIIVSASFNNKDLIDNGSIGDVKYSVLPPDQFMKLNPGWILMDGSTSKITDSIFKKSALFLDYSFRTLPDARGLFIRSLNLDRNDDKSDQYEKEKSAPRLVGDYQADAVGKHTHPINMRTGYMLILGAWQNPPPASIFVGDRPAYDNAYGTLTATDALLPITETRPKNISLYTYIKVN